MVFFLIFLVRDIIHYIHVHNIEKQLLEVYALVIVYSFLFFLVVDTVLNAEKLLEVYASGIL